MFISPETLAAASDDQRDGAGMTRPTKEGDSYSCGVILGAVGAADYTPVSSKPVGMVELEMAQWQKHFLDRNVTSASVQRPPQFMSWAGSVSHSRHAVELWSVVQDLTRYRSAERSRPQMALERFRQVALEFGVKEMPM